MTGPYPAKSRYRADEEASSYDSRRFRGVIGSLVNRIELRAIRKCLDPLGQVGRALDVAAGTGRISALLAPRTRVLVGVDISRAMLTRSPVGLAVIGDAERLPFKDGAFDVVTCVRLFGHLPVEARRAVLAEMTRVTRRHLVVAYYHRRALAPIKTAVNRLRGRCAPRFLVSPEEFEEDLARASLRLILSRGTGPQVSGIVHLLERR